MPRGPRLRSRTAAGRHSAECRTRRPPWRPTGKSACTPRSTSRCRRCRPGGPADSFRPAPCRRRCLGPRLRSRTAAGRQQAGCRARRWPRPTGKSACSRRSTSHCRQRCKSDGSRQSAPWRCSSRGFRLRSRTAAGRQQAGCRARRPPGRLTGSSVGSRRSTSHRQQRCRSGGHPESSQRAPVRRRCRGPRLRSRTAAGRQQAGCRARRCTRRPTGKSACSRRSTSQCRQRCKSDDSRRSAPCRCRCRGPRLRSRSANGRQLACRTRRCTRRPTGSSAGSRRSSGHCQPYTSDSLLCSGW
jgi:hypothetical protein